MIQIRFGNAVLKFGIAFQFEVFDASEHEASRAVFERKLELACAQEVQEVPAKFKLGRDGKGRFVKVPC